MKIINYKWLLLVLVTINVKSINAQTPSKAELIKNKDFSTETVNSISEKEKGFSNYYLVQAFLRKYEEDFNRYSIKDGCVNKEIKLLMDVKVLTSTEFATKYHFDETAFTLFLEDTPFVVTILTYFFETERKTQKKTN